jgi:hypothetical protein
MLNGISASILTDATSKDGGDAACPKTGDAAAKRIVAASSGLIRLMRMNALNRINAQ